MTAIQKATSLVLGSYRAALRTLTPEEAETLRDILCAAIAKDYLEALGHLPGIDEADRAA